MYLCLYSYVEGMHILIACHKYIFQHCALLILEVVTFF